MSAAVQRLDVSRLSASAYKTLIALDSRSAEGTLPGTLLDLLRLRVSQLNGCAYCVDAHTADALAGGEPIGRSRPSPRGPRGRGSTPGSGPHSPWPSP